MSADLDKLRAELTALILERRDIEEWLKLTAVVVQQKESRHRELRGGFQMRGLIESKRLELRDAAFPVLESGDYATTRIIAVSEKWIVTRTDGRDSEETTEFSRATGIQKRRRSSWSQRIDVAKALAIWAAHQKEVA